MFCGTDNILRNIAHIQAECEEYFAKYCQSHFTAMVLNNVMALPSRSAFFCRFPSIIFCDYSGLGSLMCGQGGQKEILNNLEFSIGGWTCGMEDPALVLLVLATCRLTNLSSIQVWRHCNNRVERKEKNIFVHSSSSLSFMSSSPPKLMGYRCLGRFLCIISQDPSVSKSSRLHVVIFRFPFISLCYIL